MRLFRCNSSLGEQVKVSLIFVVRAWTNPAGRTKYFNTLEAWKIERLDGNGGKYSGKGASNESKRTE
jgi:hypothetical protein